MAEPVDLVEVASQGDRRLTLIALRDTLTRTIVDAEPSNVAALAKQLRDTLTELAAIGEPGKVDRVDELAARRPTATEVQVKSGRSGKRRTSGD